MKPFTKSQVKRIFSQLGHDPEVISSTKNYIIARFYSKVALVDLEKIKKAFKGKSIEIDIGDFDGLDLTIILKE